MLRKKCLEFVKTKQKNNKNITTNSITGNKNNFHFNSSFRKINTTQNNEIIRLEKLLEVSISGAKEASKSIKNIWKSNDLGIVHKGESATDLLTKADLSSHTILINRLTNEFKNLKIISEEDIFSNEKDVLSTSKVPETPLNLKISEQFEYLTTDEVCLFIDPLDGTIGFTNGHLESTMILIGVAYYGKPIAGIMCQPFYSNGEEEEEYGRIICGVVGSGCVSTSPLQKLEKPATFNNENIRLVTTLYHTTAVMEDTIEKFPPSTQIIRKPGAGYKALMVMEGKADVYCYPRSGTNLWDTCAPEACIRSINGNITDCNGNFLKYHKDSSIDNLNGVLFSMFYHQNYLNFLQK